jgi:hypothetical protein
MSLLVAQEGGKKWKQKNRPVVHRGASTVLYATKGMKPKKAHPMQKTAPMITARSSAFLLVSLCKGGGSKKRRQT